MKCPQCGAVTPDDEWNCRSCRARDESLARYLRPAVRVRIRPQWTVLVGMAPRRPATKAVRVL